MKSSETILWQKFDRCTTFSASWLFWLKTPFCFRCHRLAGKLILTTWLEMNEYDVVYLYYAQKTKIMVEFSRIWPFSKNPADMHNVSLRTFVECIPFCLGSYEIDNRYCCLFMVSKLLSLILTLEFTATPLFAI